MKFLVHKKKIENIKHETNYFIFNRKLKHLQNKNFRNLIDFNKKVGKLRKKNILSFLNTKNFIFFIKNKFLK